VVFVIALIVGVQALVALLAPYSAWGRIVQNLFQPVYLWINNLFAKLAERADSYAFYEKEVWLRSLPTFIVAAVTFVVIAILAWRNGRTYCNTICPVGTTLSFFSRFAMFRPMIDTNVCKKCKSCEHNCKASCIDVENQKIDYSRCVACFNCIDSCKLGGLKYKFAWKKRSDAESSAPAPEQNGRRAFITGAALAVGTAALKAQEKKVDGGFAAIMDKEVPGRDIPVTPPGSKSVKDFYRRCTACQLCVAECPNNILRPSTDLKHFMQPEMSFERGYCRPECTRCSEVCPTAAIAKITKEEKTQYHVGTARVNPDLCVVEQGVECGNCARHCPAGAISLVKDEETGYRRPVVNEERCIGCGACENLCPARPISAITVNGRHSHLNED